jgi:hypothetical protein
MEFLGPNSKSFDQSKRPQAEIMALDDGYVVVATIESKLIANKILVPDGTAS